MQNDCKVPLKTSVKLKAISCFLGYSVELFGIQSNCLITETILDKHFCLPLIVNVTPKLPLLQFQSAISEVKSFVNSSHRGSSLTLDVTLHRGQRYRVCLFAATTLKARRFRFVTCCYFCKNFVALDVIPVSFNSCSYFLLFSVSFNPLAFCYLLLVFRILEIVSY